MYKGYKLGIVVPAFNEEKLIEDTLKNLPDYADKIYVVDDASTDNTKLIAEQYIDERLLVIQNGQNSGVGASIVKGYKKALEDDLDIVAVMAGDNQMDSQFLPSLLEPLLMGEADYSKGNRLSKYQHKKGMSNWRFFGNWLLTMLTKISSGYWKISDPQNGYTAVTQNALKRINLDKIYPRYGYPNDVLVKLNVAGCKVVDVPIPARYGKEKSKIRYGNFIAKVAPLLLRGFFWRLKNKYL
ncbi:MAG: glycosyltransferase family 2 protein [Dehalococcoidales bacterium]|nr:glycosyltransferase family 2 protein [Dehalococcoidales bacterium]